MTDDNTFNISKIDTRVNEAAKNYSISKYKLRDGIGYVNQPCVEDFTAGVNWERERSKKLIQKANSALKYAYEDHSDQFYLNVIEELEK